MCAHTASARRVRVPRGAAGQLALTRLRQRRLDLLQRVSVRARVSPRAQMLAWLRLTLSVDSRCVLSRARAPRSFILKCACCLFSFFPLPTAFLLHPASPARARLKLTEADQGGIQQYMLVLCVASFFASYTLEFRTFQRLESEAGPQKEQKLKGNEVDLKQE